MIPKLRQYLADWLLKNPGVYPKSFRHLNEFKYGYDNFSFDSYNMKNSGEQGIFKLLPKGINYPNSFLQSVPILFLWNVTEDHPSLRAIADKVESPSWAKIQTYPRAPHNMRVAALLISQIPAK